MALGESQPGYVEGCLFEEQCSGYNALGGLAMPLRDHFRPPLDNRRSWEELHGGWPMMLVAALSRRLPPRYVAGPRVHLGAYFEIDVASYEEDESAPLDSGGGAAEGGVATEVWAPPQPTLAVTTDLPD